MLRYSQPKNEERKKHIRLPRKIVYFYYCISAARSPYLQGSWRFSRASESLSEYETNDGCDPKCD